MIYNTQTEFRKAAGVSKSTMSRYVRRPDWPVKRFAPWSKADLAKVRRWRRGLQENRAQDAPDDPEFTAYCRREFPQLFDPEYWRRLREFLYNDGELPI